MCVNRNLICFIFQISGVFQLVDLILMLMLFSATSGFEHDDDMIRLVDGAVFNTQKGCVDLTRLVSGYPTTTPCRSVGVIYHNRHIPSIINLNCGIMNSFTTEFTFSVNTSINPTSFGDDLAFVPTYEAKAGTSVGSYALPHKHFALVIDTHVEDAIGVSQTQYFRVFTQSVVFVGFAKIDEYVTSGEKYHVWFEYLAELIIVLVFIASSNANKPALPILDLPINTNEVFNREDYVYFGFVGASRGCNELYNICSLNLNIKQPKHHLIWLFVVDKKVGDG
jgi:hypothetical protein